MDFSGGNQTALAKHHIKLITLSCTLLGVAFLGFAYVYDSPPKVPAQHSLRSWQEADAPPGYPVEVTEEGEGRVPAFDSRFLMLDAIERFSIPVAREFTAPLGSESGALSLREATFGSKVGDKVMLGDRLGGIGGGDTDLSDPVRAVGNGLVLYAGEGGPDQGKVLILGHRLPDGKILQSYYGSLRRIDVPRGGVVARGSVIGTVGTNGGGEPAHLQFEFRESDGLEIGPLLAGTLQNRLDPVAVLTHHQRAEESHLAPEPLAFRDRPSWEDRVILKNPDKASGLFGAD
jgi:hypothetical protein